MTPATETRLINNILKAINANNSHLLTKPSIKWIIENYWLRPGNLHYLTHIDEWCFNKGLLNDCLTEFHNWFNNSLTYHFSNDTDLNYALSWINAWFTKKNYGGTPENLELCYDNFKQRIKIVNILRNKLGFKTYKLRFLQPNHRNRVKKYTNIVYARNPHEAVERLIEHRKNLKIQSLRVIKQNAEFVIDPSYPKELISRLSP